MVLSGLNATHVPIQLLQILTEWLGTGSRASLQILLTQTFYRRKNKQTTLDITSSEKDHEIELQIGRFFIASNSAFLQVENKKFEKTIPILKPGERFPNRKKISWTNTG